MLDRATGRARGRLPSRAESPPRPENRGDSPRPVIAAPEPPRLPQWAPPHLFADRPPPTDPFLPVSSVSCGLPRKTCCQLGYSFDHRHHSVRRTSLVLTSSLPSYCRSRLNAAFLRTVEYCSHVALWISRLCPAGTDRSRIPRSAGCKTRRRGIEEPDGSTARRRFERGLRHCGVRSQQVQGGRTRDHDRALQGMDESAADGVRGSRRQQRKNAHAGTIQGTCEFRPVSG